MFSDSRALAIFSFVQHYTISYMQSLMKKTI